MELTNIYVTEQEQAQHTVYPQLEAYAHSLPLTVSTQTYAWLRVKTLGFGSEEGNSKEKDGKREIAVAATLLSTIGIPFSLLCERSKMDERITFAIGCEQSSVIAAVLRAAFGIADVETYTPSFFSGNSVQKVFLAQDFCAVKTDEEELKNRKSSEETEVFSWANETARILGDFTGAVRVDFCPVEEKNSSTLVENAEKMIDAITDYTETDISVSDQIAYNPVDSFWRKKRENLVGNLSKTDVSANASLSWKNSFSALEARKEEETFYAKLYRQALAEGWVIGFSVCADPGIGKTDSKAVADRAFALMTPLTGAVAKAGFSCLWESCIIDSAQKNRQAGLVLPRERAAEFISLPDSSFFGFERMDNYYYNVNLPEEQQDVRIGTLIQYNRETGMPVYLPKEQMNRHIFVCGMTGSGKTNTVHQLLSNTGDLPYLAIEPVKGEYHKLPGVTAYTMTAGSRSALILNPFWFPKGSNLQYHIDCIKQIISSAFDLYAAMPNILEQCLNHVYQHCGWDLVQGKNHYEEILPEEMLYPTFSDLCREVELYLENSKFGAESKGNYQGALLSRLQSFTSGSKGMLLNTPAHIDFESWMNKKIVVSLDALADDADKSIVMGVILAQYFQFLRIKHKAEEKRGEGNNALRHLTVIEEAHHLFSADAHASSGSAEGGSGQSASADFVKTLNNMLAEIRSYGEGFIIVDQSPSALHPGVLKNTGVKIVHRTDYGEDIHTLQEALLLEDDDYEPAMLNKGQSLLRFGGMRTSAKVHIDLSKTKEKSTNDVDEEVIGNSVVNHLLEDDTLNTKVKELIVARLFNHLLYDDLSNFKNVYPVLYNELGRLLLVYGHFEIVGGEESEKNLSKYLISLLPDVIEKAFPSQYTLEKLIVLFSQRFLLICNESHNQISKQELGAFEDYRAGNILPKITRFWTATYHPVIAEIKKHMDYVVPETNLFAKVIADLEKTDTDYTNRQAIFEYYLEHKYFLVKPTTATRMFPVVNGIIVKKNKEEK